MKHSAAFSIERNHRLFCGIKLHYRETTNYKLQSGVLQQSVLGPLSFVMYINDIDDCVAGKILNLQMTPKFTEQLSHQMLVLCSPTSVT